MPVCILHIAKFKHPEIMLFPRYITLIAEEKKTEKNDAVLLCHKCGSEATHTHTHTVSSGGV